MPVLICCAIPACSTFTEEAERHCKTAGEVLEEGLTVSGQGLVYNFDNAQYGSYKVRITPNSAFRHSPFQSVCSASKSASCAQ